MISERRRLFRVSGRHDHRGRDHPSADLSSESQDAAIFKRRHLFQVSSESQAATITEAVITRAQTSLPSLRPPRSPSVDVSSESQAATITEAEITRAQTFPSLRVPRSPSADVSSESQAAAISEHRRLFRVSGHHDHRGRDRLSLSQAAAISSADQVI